MQAFVVVTDADGLDIDFQRVVENPEIRAIEIVQLETTTTGEPGARNFVSVIANPGSNTLDADLLDVEHTLAGPGATDPATSVASGCEPAVPGPVAPGETVECRFVVDIVGGGGDSFTDVVDVTGAFTGGQNADVTSAAVTIDLTSVPTAPSNLTSVDGDGVVDLDWDDVAGASGYDVYRGTAPGVTPATGTQLTVSPVVGSDFSDTTVANGTIYYYVVTATNGTESGPASVEVSGHPLPDTAVIARINSGGGVLTASDALADWEADTAAGNHPWLAVAGTNNVGGFTVEDAIRRCRATCRSHCSPRSATTAPPERRT